MCIWLSRFLLIWTWICALGVLSLAPNFLEKTPFPRTIPDREHKVKVIIDACQRGNQLIKDELLPFLNSNKMNHYLVNKHFGSNADLAKIKDKLTKVSRLVLPIVRFTGSSGWRADYDNVEMGDSEVYWGTVKTVRIRDAFYDANDAVKVATLIKTGVEFLRPLPRWKVKEPIPTDEVPWRYYDFVIECSRVLNNPTVRDRMRSWRGRLGLLPKS